jgi:hypothetical protein
MFWLGERNDSNRVVRVDGTEARPGVVPLEVVDTSAVIRLECLDKVSVFG